MTDIVSFQEIQTMCAVEGLTAVGVLTPVPQQLDPTGFDRMEADGLGDLEWMQRTRHQRLSPTFMMPEAQSL
jgi:hypothetical protein